MPPPRPTSDLADPNPARYLRLTALGAATTFLALWAWIAAAPMAYLDPEYPFWRAKQVMLHDCDLGDVLILGDSHAAAGILAAELPMKSINLAVGGGKPIEAYVALTRALACPNPPRRVVLSFDPVHFMSPDLFWERAVRFGFVGAQDLALLRTVAAERNDPTLHARQRFAGLPDWVRDWLYVERFPSLYLGSVIQGGVVMRWKRNSDALTTALAARGHYYFGIDSGSSAVAIDGHLDAFTPAPVLDWYFDQILAMLAARGIPADFVSTPMNGATAVHVQPALKDGFTAYLAAYAARYPHFQVIGPILPAWPDRLFGDEFAHLNPAGAELFTTELGRCLEMRLADRDAAACRFDKPPSAKLAGR